MCYPDQLELSVAIGRSAAAAYDFLALPQNFPRWASGVGRALRAAGGDWVAQTAQGPTTLRFTDRNRRGVLDYSVTPPCGSPAYVRLRLAAKAGGCELAATLFREPGMSNEKFAAKAQRTMRDLHAAKRILEAAEVPQPA